MKKLITAAVLPFILSACNGHHATYVGTPAGWIQSAQIAFDNQKNTDVLDIGYRNNSRQSLNIPVKVIDGPGAVTVTATNGTVILVMTKPTDADATGVLLYSCSDCDTSRYPVVWRKIPG